MVKKIFLAVIIAFLSAFPLLSKGLPPTHDGEYHVIRFYEFNKTLLDGNFYPRWASDLNNGFGVPLFNYVYPFPNYIASFLHLFNFSFIDSFKISMFITIILGALFFYLWTREFWGEWGALVSSTFYSFSPYHLLDTYIRGSVGEVWAFAFFPGFLWGITKFINEKNFIFGIISSIFLGLLIFSHNILALMFIVFSVFYCLLIIKNKKDFSFIKRLIFIYFLGIGLSAIFWLPAIFEKQFVRGLEVYDYSKNFPEFYQLIIPSWGSGFSGELLSNELSFQIGIANLFVIFLSIILILKKKFKDFKKIVYFFLISFFIVSFLILSISKPIWQIIPLMNYFQFPWRFLSLEIIICSFLAGGITLFWKKKLVSVLLIISVILLGIGYANFAYYHQRNDTYYISRSNFIDGTNSPGNAFNTIWFNGQLKKTNYKLTFIKGSGSISNINIKTTKYEAEIISLKDSEILVNTAYFPRWSVYVDGNKTRVLGTADGLFSFTLSKGKHSILVQFEDTYIRKFSMFLFFLSLFILLLNVFKSVKIKK